MGRGKQIDLRRQFHGTVSPISISINSQLTGAHEVFEPILSRLHFVSAVSWPGGKLFRQDGSLFRIRFKGRYNIDPIQGAKMIKVDNVIKYTVSSHDQVADVLSI